MLKFKLFLFAFFTVIFETTAQSEVIIQDDSTYRAIKFDGNREKLPTLEGIKSRQVMENDAIYRQLRIFFHEKSIKLTDKGLDCYLTLRFYMTAQNEVTAVTYDFSNMYFRDNKMLREVFSATQEDSLANILGLQESLGHFANDLVFNRKYLNAHVHRLGFNLKREGTETRENKLAKLLENSRPDTVKTIDLSNTGLTEIPLKELKRFKNAQTLTLDNNKLESLPKQLLRLRKLKVMDVSGNYLTENSTVFKRHKRLEVLNIQNNAFATLPKSLKKLKRMKNLVMGNNSFHDLDAYKFYKHKRLTDLNFYNLNLDHVPASVYKMKSLESLDLYFNNVNYLPEEIAQIKTLKTLAVAYNDMWSLPQAINQLPKLKTIYAHHNQLTRLPDLPQSIEELDIGYNSFESFPNNIANLPSLTILDYNQNNLRQGIDAKLLPSSLKTFYVWSNLLFQNEAYKEAAEEFKMAMERMGVEVN